MPAASASSRVGRARAVRSRVAIVAHAVLLRKSGAERGDGDDAVAFGETHDDDAAGARRVAVDRVGFGPDDLTAGADEQELLVLLGDLLDGGQVPGLAALEADQTDTLAAAVLAPELRQCHALAVPGLGQHEQVALGLDDTHPDDRIALPGEPDPDDAGRVATHRPDLVLGEPGELALGGGDDHVVIAGRNVDPGEFVVVAQDDRPDPGRADLLELLERGLLDDALARGQDEVRAGLEVGKRDRRHRHLARLDLDARQVDDRDPLGLAAGIGDGVDLGAEHATTVREEQRPVVGIGHEEVLDSILLARDVADDPLPTTVLASMPNWRHCCATIEPARVITGRPSPSTVILSANGLPSGVIHWLPFFLKPAFCSSSAAAARAGFHQPIPKALAMSSGFSGI